LAHSFIMQDKGVGVDNIADFPATLSALSYIQERFALLNLSGEIRIVDRLQIAEVIAGKQGEISFYKRPEGQLLIYRELENLPISSKPKDVFNDFLVNPNTHVYNAIAFSPLLTPASTLNYWVDPSIQAKEGDWFILQEFLHTVICNNDVVLFDYIIYYLAHMVQKPEEKPGIMIVLLSGQGTGKGTLFRLIERLWPRTTLVVSDIAEVVGQFNASLERNFVVCMDEALFHGDKKSIEKLKSLITEPKCRIEQKYQPSRTIDSYHRLFASSNHNHFAQVDKDDRRFLFIRVSSVHKQDQIYFDSVNEALESDDVIAAMMFDLMNIDLTDFNVRKRPITEEHLSQRLQSLGGFERFWFEVLQTGYFKRGSYSGVTWKESTFISTEYLIEAYKEYDRNANKYQPIQSQQLASTIKSLCPSTEPTRRTNQGSQERGYQLPDLSTARAEFEQTFGPNLIWESLDDELAKAAI
jgi:hypothetical protein